MTNISLTISNLPEIQKALGNKPAKRAIKHCLQVIQKVGRATLADLLEATYDAKEDTFTPETFDIFLEGDVFRFGFDAVEMLPQIDPATMPRDHAAQAIWKIEVVIRGGVNAAFYAINPNITSIRGSYSPMFDQHCLKRYAVDMLTRFNHPNWRSV